ncbi:NADP-dependent oxidoreductase domain-containing protein [Mucidula mucida]|nr:NADP-dependent oxidoreductase domain-containing protein [Mucidula mucida]
MSLDNNTISIRLGSSGLKISKLILGCMSYGNPGWYSWILPEEEGFKHIKAAYDAGINTFNTSDVYSNGCSEVILGKAIKEYKLPRDEIVVMTKLWGVVGRDYSGPMIRDSEKAQQEGYVNQFGLSRKHIFSAVKKSLERLQLNYVDVLQCHRFDPTTPIAETMQALHDVVQAGYARYIGMSSCYAYQYYALEHNLTPFISMQNHYNLVYREEERDMFHTLKHFGVGAIPWSPLARGVVTRPLEERGSGRTASDALLNVYFTSPATNDIVNRVEEVAKKKGITMAQVAVAWSMSKEGVTAPIIGSTSLDNLNQLIAAVDITLTEEEIKYLEEPYKPMQSFIEAASLS